MGGSASRLRLQSPPEEGVHVLGPIALDCLHVNVLEETRVYPPEIDEAASKNWEEALRKRPHLFDGPCWAVRQWQVRERNASSSPRASEPAQSSWLWLFLQSVCFGCVERKAKGPEMELRIVLQQTSFKYVLYTHHSEACKDLAAEDRAGAGGLMALTVTSDGFFVLGKRSQRLAASPGCWHCLPAGQIDSPNLEEVLRKELREEAAVTWSSVLAVDLFALLDVLDSGHRYEFVFRLQLDLTAGDLYERRLQAEDSFEHDAVLFVAVPGVGDVSKYRRGAGSEPAEVSGNAAGKGLGASEVPVATISEVLSGDMEFTYVTRKAVELLQQVSTR